MCPKNRRTLLAMVLTIIIYLTFLIFGSAVYAEDSLAKAARINEGCLRCHGAQGLKTKFDGNTVSLYVDEEKYKVSMHGTMACTYCHTNISDYPHTKALTGKALVDQVNSECRRCHQDVTSLYKTSIHGQLNKKKGQLNAYCSDCHGIHNIYKKEDLKATIYHSNVIKTCGKCHEEIYEKAYMESFHGKSVFLGGKKAASCVSCHGSHTILGPANPASTVYKDNIPETCAKCHLYPLENFKEGKEHFFLEPKGDGAPMFWTLMFFTWLTIIVVTTLIIHMELELYRKLKNAGTTDVNRRKDVNTDKNYPV